MFYTQIGKLYATLLVLYMLPIKIRNFFSFQIKASTINGSGPGTDKAGAIKQGSNVL